MRHRKILCDLPRGSELPNLSEHLPVFLSGAVGERLQHGVVQCWGGVGDRGVCGGGSGGPGNDNYHLTGCPKSF